jgi:hypothetical protein
VASGRICCGVVAAEAVSPSPTLPSPLHILTWMTPPD